MTIIIGSMFGANLETILNKSISILVQTYLKMIFSHNAQVKREASSGFIEELVCDGFPTWGELLKSWQRHYLYGNFHFRATLLVLFADIAWGLVVTHWHLWVFKHIWFAEWARELVSMFSDICEYLNVLIVFTNLCMCTSPTKHWIGWQNKKRVRGEWDSFNDRCLLQ